MSLKSPASRWFAQPFVQAHTKANIKALCHWPSWGESTGDRWIPLTKGLITRKMPPMDDAWTMWNISQLHEAHRHMPILTYTKYCPSTTLLRVPYRLKNSIYFIPVKLHWLYVPYVSPDHTCPLIHLYDCINYCVGLCVPGRVGTFQRHICSCFTFSLSQAIVISWCR